LTNRALAFGNLQNMIDKKLREQSKTSWNSNLRVKSTARAVSARVAKPGTSFVEPKGFSQSAQKPSAIA